MCRAFLSPRRDKDGKLQFEGRFNQGVVTINLPQVALSLKDRTEEEYFKELDKRLEITKEALLCRHNNLKELKPMASPIHWMYGGVARKKANESIEDILVGGYSTLTLGYIGFYETSKLMTGESNTSEKGKAFSMKLMKHLKDKVDQWKEETNIGFALYGTPAESLCYRFARIDKEKFGADEDITGKNYYTNSYHCDVREDMDAISKLSYEAPFQELSTGGCISYVEIPNLVKNPEAVESLIKYIYDNIQYAEFNTKTDYCANCGYDGELKIKDKIKWYCPNCGCEEKQFLTVVRRSCFTKDNLVLTKDGYKSIDKIKTGDLVLTKDNRYKEVVDAFAEEDKDTLFIYARGIDKIHCTPDHPFLVRSLDKPRNKNGRIRYKTGLTDPYYKLACDLTKDDYLVSNINNKEEAVQHDTLPVDNPDFWYIVGRVVAGGWVSNPYIRKDTNKDVYVTHLCTGKHKADDLQTHLDKIEGLFGLKKEKETVYQWRSYNKDLYDFLSQIGKGASNKSIPQKWIDMPNNLLESLLKGIMDGDGRKTKDGLNILRSTSRSLIYAVQSIVNKLYKLPAKVYKVRKADTMNILGRVCNTHDVYDVKWHNEPKKGQRLLIRDGQILIPFIKKEEQGAETVYSLTVLDDASYTVQNTIVKNCGYIGSNFRNDGKTQEIDKRVLHVN